MKNKTSYFVLVVLFVAIVTILFFQRKTASQTENSVTRQQEQSSDISDQEEKKSAADSRDNFELSETQKINSAAASASHQSEPRAEPVKNTVPYEIDDEGLAIVDGDIVLGMASEGQSPKGQTQATELKLWPGGRVPFFIQGDLEHPERVIKAIAMFVDTPIQLVPYQGEEDVLVFGTSSSACRSYLGKVGGKQPVWVGPQCGTTEIAHEIMHALGFIHEQNRSDRDTYVKILWDNIIDSSKPNFELFPKSLMTVSGAAAFDFQSMMLYPATMFAKNGLQALWPLDPKNEINPSRQLSAGDLLRLESAYRK